jgi:Icc protein
VYRTRYRVIVMLLVLFPLTMELPVQAANTRINEPIFTFSVLSDLHITGWDQESHRLFRSALSDHTELHPTSSLLVLNGDLTNGHAEDYEALGQLLQEQKHAPVHATMGNHEYYGLWRTPQGGMDTTKLNETWSSLKATQLFTQFFNYEKPYHDLWIKDIHFIFLSGEAYRDVDAGIREDAYLSKEQLGWLKKTLTSTSGHINPLRRLLRKRPTFVFLHQPLPHTLDGTDSEQGVAQNQELYKLLKSTPNVFLFSGHTHYELGQTRQIHQHDFLSVGTSSIRYVVNANNEPVSPPLSQSLVIEVFKDRVNIRGREHSTRSWLSTYSLMYR